MEGAVCAFDEQNIQRCPFLKNINKPTNFSYLSTTNLPSQPSGSRGPIFEDDHNFDMVFMLFHGKNGVVPLVTSSYIHEDPQSEPESAPKFSALAASAATISLSSFGLGGPFGFDAFADKWKKQKKKHDEGSQAKHEALGNEWLQYGNCPISKSYRAVNHVLPLIAQVCQPPPGMKFRCPAAVAAARAALSKTQLAKNLRPQPLTSKMLAIASLGMAINIPLGIWREHTRKFSPSWFMAVHAAVPFIGMLRKAILMPKMAMALTIAASILGQSIGARAERLRMKADAERLGNDGIGSNCAKEEIVCGSHLHVQQDSLSSSLASVCF